MNLTNQNDILLLNRLIPLFPLDTHFSVDNLARQSNSKIDDCEKIINYLRDNNFVKTGIYSQLQREENQLDALLTLTDKGRELKTCYRYENYLKKIKDAEDKVVKDNRSKKINTIATIIGAIAAVVAAVASVWALLK